MDDQSISIDIEDYEDVHKTMNPKKSTTMDFDTAIEEANAAINLFLNNQFQDAWNILRPWVGTSMYHTVGNSIFHFLEAVLTYEAENIQKASDALKNSMSLCNYYRKKKSVPDLLGKMVRRSSYDMYSIDEIHAELCYAESLLLKAMLTFIEDETLFGLIKASLKIKFCFSSYKECQVILNNKNWLNDNNKIHFESGVRMGIGTFNLMISLIPSRFSKLLEFVGFSGSKEVGIDELVKSCNLREGLRHPFSVLILLSYNLYVIYILSRSDGDIQLCEEILNPELEDYPNSAWFLFFKGRLEFTKGNLTESITWYTKSWKSQSIWPQFHHLCFWELMWICIIVQDWEQAQRYSDMLLKESKWSRTIYSYQKAAVMLMRYDDLTVEEKIEVKQLMTNTSSYKQKIVGKSIPMEKFCIKKSERFKVQNHNLVLPALELIFVWNLFKVFGKQQEYCAITYEVIEQTLYKLEHGSQTGMYDADNRALVYLLKGACLHQMKKPLEAEEALKNVLSLKEKIKDDIYLVPYALVELAFIYYEQGDKNRTIKIFEDVKKSYTGYPLESRLHFQIHLANLEINKNSIKNEVKISQPSTSSS